MSHTVQGRSSDADGFALTFTIGETLARFEGRTIDAQLITAMERALNTELSSFLDGRQVQLKLKNGQIEVHVHASSARASSGKAIAA